MEDFIKQLSEDYEVSEEKIRKYKNDLIRLCDYLDDENTDDLKIILEEVVSYTSTFEENDTSSYNLSDVYKKFIAGHFEHTYIEDKYIEDDYSDGNIDDYSVKKR